MTLVLVQVDITQHFRVFPKRLHDLFYGLLTNFNIKGDGEISPVTFDQSRQNQPTV